jgi:hypothetical protein
MGHTAARVSFAVSAQAARQPDDEEHYVMSRFAKHASHCVRCNDPVEAYLSSGALCESGNKYAREVAQYVYSKNGKAYSVVDRQQRHEKIQIEVPVTCAVIKTLCKAVDQGLTLKRDSPKIIDHRTSPAERRPAERRGDYDTVTIRPSSSREEKRRHDGREKRKSTVYVKGRGSLYEKDEAERRQRYEGQPIIVDVVPGRRYNR